MFAVLASNFIFLLPPFFSSKSSNSFSRSVFPMSAEAAKPETSTSNNLPDAAAKPVAPPKAEGVESVLSGLPTRDYLEATVVHVLVQGLKAVCRERPHNPVDYLALYLLKHNPSKCVTVEVPLK